MALIGGYQQIGFDLAKPHLRAHMESGMKLVSEGGQDKNCFVREVLHQMHEVYEGIQSKRNQLSLHFRQSYLLHSEN